MPPARTPEVAGLAAGAPRTLWPGQGQPRGVRPSRPQALPPPGTSPWWGGACAVQSPQTRRGPAQTGAVRREPWGGRPPCRGPGPAPVACQPPAPTASDQALSLLGCAGRGSPRSPAFPAATSHPQKPQCPASPPPATLKFTFDARPGGAARTWSHQQLKSRLRTSERTALATGVAPAHSHPGLAVTPSRKQRGEAQRQALRHAGSSDCSQDLQVED